MDPLDDHGLALIFADQPSAALPYLEAVNAFGGRAVVMGLDEVPDRLASQGAARAVIVDLGAAALTGIEAIVRHVERFADEVDALAIINCSMTALESVFAASERHSTEILCESGIADRIASISLAWPRRRPRLADSAVEIDSVRLKRLADEVQRIAKALHGLSAIGDGAATPDYRRPPTEAISDRRTAFEAQPRMIGTRPIPEAAEIRSLIRLRRLRESFFDAELFADPAWDILLDLFAARIEGDQVAVSSLCIAAAVPPTTALRWIKTMTDERLLERHADPMDGRRIFIRLTESAAEGMERYFEAAKRTGGLII